MDINGILYSVDAQLRDSMGMHGCDPDPRFSFGTMQVGSGRVQFSDGDYTIHRQINTENDGSCSIYTLGAYEDDSNKPCVCDHNDPLLMAEASAMGGVLTVFRNMEDGSWIHAFPEALEAWPLVTIQ